jgi:ligand-binding SRPBCC domain-containing protein
VPQSARIPSVLEIVVTSELAADPEAVWRRVTSAPGINHELGPWLRMTAPAGIDLEAAPLGRRWFRSWVLLLGVLPIDYDDLCIERFEPGRGFLECSQMLSARTWRHERTLEHLTGGTRVRDAVSFEPRVRLAARLHGAVIEAIFRHRHRRLASWFGAAAGAGS